jgi:histidinol-phosphatase (PHP family)
VSLSHDYHAHSSYSDGSFLYRMTEAAQQAGLDGIGFTDHCNVSEREPMRRVTYALGFNLDQTYERRRTAIESLREQFDIRIFDAVEMDYHPADEAQIRAFLADAGFDYSIGSVHHLEDTNVHFEEHFAGRSADEYRRLVDSYFDQLVSLVESELFDVAAHLDLLERNSLLRGRATQAQYERVAEALAESRTVPEINAGRVLDDYGQFHPAPAFLEALREYEVPVTVGTDSHQPGEIEPRVDALETYLADQGLEAVRVVD